MTEECARNVQNHKCHGEGSLAPNLYSIYQFKSEHYQMRFQIRIQTELKGVVLIKWVQFLARNIKMQKVDMDLSGNQITSS